MTPSKDYLMYEYYNEYHERIRQDTHDFLHFHRANMSRIVVGRRYLFVYPDFRGWHLRPDGTKDYVPESHPDATAHRFSVVQVVRELIEGEEYDSEPGEAADGNELPGERMYEIEADDGWSFLAWETELFPLTLAEYAAEHGDGA